MDIQNHYYGHSAALARHAGLDSVRHIDGLLQHGWTVRSPVTVHFADFPRLPRGARRLVWSHASRAQDAGSGASPLVFLRHPLSHLPGRLPRVPAHDALLPAPLTPAR